MDGPLHTGINITALFDPLTNMWSQGQPMTYERWYGTASSATDFVIMSSVYLSFVRGPQANGR